MPPPVSPQRMLVTSVQLYSPTQFLLTGSALSGSVLQSVEVNKDLIPPPNSNAANGSIVTNGTSATVYMGSTKWTHLQSCIGTGPFNISVTHANGTVSAFTCTPAPALAHAIEHELQAIKNDIQEIRQLLLERAFPVKSEPEWRRHMMQLLQMLRSYPPISDKDLSEQVLRDPHPAEQRLTKEADEA